MTTDTARGDQPHNHLLLFYATECGLKALLCRQRRVRGTEELTDLDHNLKGLIRELGIQANDLSAPPSFRLRGESTPHECEMAHQAWRYGADVEPAEQSQLVDWLNRACHHLKETL